MKSPELISNTINVDRGGISQVCEELTFAHQERCSPPEKCSEEFRESFSSWHLLSLTGLKKWKGRLFGLVPNCHSKVHVLETSLPAAGATGIRENI